MIGWLRFVGSGAAWLATVAIVPGVLAGPPVPPLQHPPSPAILQTAALVQDDAPPATPLNPYTPPACVPGVPFSDIICTTGFDAWIEQFGYDRITAGCGGGKYCPGTPVTRDQMAVFVEKAMRGTEMWSPGDLGNSNTGLGRGSLFANTTGGSNTGLGYFSLRNNTTGLSNAGVGDNSLFFNTSASCNVAIGSGALYNQSYNPGSAWYSYNTALGEAALFSNEPTSISNGMWNTAVGASGLYHNTTGRRNTSVGVKAGARAGDVITGYGGTNVTLVSTVTGSFNTFVGIAGSTAEVSNCTAVGMDAYCDASNEVRLGNTFVTSISGKVNFSALSDARGKTDIRDLDLGLDFVMSLRPVTYHLKGGNGRTDMGFVAQDLETLLGDGYNVLGIGGDRDRTLSLRYTDFIAPMVKAIQEQQAQIESRDARISALEARLAAIEARLASK